VQHLDALLGGGIVSSDPILFSSTPETGKSTLAFQFSKAFQMLYPNSVVVYLDIEGSGNKKESEFRQSRQEIFDLDLNRFKHEPIVVTVDGVFELMERLIQIKQQFEEKLNKQFYIAFIWDSIASTPIPKTLEAENPNSIIGAKARQVSFLLDKYTPLIKFNKVTLICIDQIRANIKIDGPYVQQEKSVGTFKDYKSATNIYALQHRTQQWIFLSKKKVLPPSEGLGIDGWYMDIYTEKNKLAPSQHAVTCVFDKKTGIHKFWSEFTFLMEPTPSEKKIYKSSPPASLFMMKKVSPRVKLVVTDEHGTKMWESEPFYRKNANEKYESDPEFAKWFDYAVQVSVYNRITQGIFKCDQGQYDAVSDECTIDPTVHNVLVDTLGDEDTVGAAPEIQNETQEPQEEVEQVGEEFFLGQPAVEAKSGYKSVFESDTP
jgi:RecA/RadA recombinase